MPYFSVNIGVLTKKSDNNQKLSNLTNKKVLVKQGTTAEAFSNHKG